LADSKKAFGYKAIGDYAIIGDCHSAALVARNGSIDFCCLPYFDSGAVFCRLLDQHKGGYFQVGPANDYNSSRRYLEKTNVLVTTFETESGSLQLTDLMPIRRVREDQRGKDVDAPHRIIRRARVTQGELEIAITLKATFDFARLEARPIWREGKGVILKAANRFLTLTFPVKLEQRGEALSGKLTLKKGEQVDFILTYADTLDAAEEALAVDGIDQQLEETISYWRDWSARSHYEGPHADVVMRSALVLKLMTFEPTGAIIAAPTTSLPEEIGGVRNWDYRFSWMRDATFTLLALLRLGYTGEARDFMKFIADICATHAEQKSRMQIMYGITGELPLKEQTLDHLEGYRGSRPVRVGNAAYGQKQLDIFGEVLDCVYMFYRHGGFGERGVEMSDAMWEIIKGTVEYAVAHWREKDAGIWEVRDEERDYLYSKVMCWVAVDRGIKLAEDMRRGLNIQHWRAVRDHIHGSILEEGFNERVGAFTQSYGAEALDAAALRMPLVGFLPAADQKMRMTVEAIQARLMENGLVYRYHSALDGLPGGEGTFLICTLWLIQCLALMGRVEEAEERFVGVLAYANDVGLFAEEIDAQTGEQLGNFPQAFTHIALINAAADLAESAARRRHSGL
jgi:GH15 family glucan-1,4-alpha-glucosidase